MGTFITVHDRQTKESIIIRVESIWKLMAEGHFDEEGYKREHTVIGLRNVSEDIEVSEPVVDIYNLIKESGRRNNSSEKEKTKEEVIKKLEEQIDIQAKELKKINCLVTIPEPLLYSVSYARGLFQGTLQAYEGFVKILKDSNINII